MEKVIQYKKQGNGQDSWIIRYLDENGENVQLPEIIYEDPSLSPIEEEKLKYDQRVKDGMDEYLMLMAELRLNSIANNLPREVNKYIEEKLESVRIQVVSGQWWSALEKLETVVVESYLTQELYDRIYLKITTYISESYTIQN